MTLNIVHNILVTIVVPIYNVELYLNQCLDSIIRQTYSNLEIILVDDGSTDNCRKICDEYADRDSRIKVIHKPNGGLSDARNAGLEAAKGKYIYFIDSDDFIELDSIETLIEEAEHYSADTVFFDANIFSGLANTNYPQDYYIRKGLYSNPLKGVDMLAQLLKNKEYKSSVPLLFTRRDILIDNNLSFYKDIVYEDQLFTFRLFLYSKLVVHVAEPLYNRRIRKHSIMTSEIGINNFRSIIIIITEMVHIYLKEEAISDYHREVIRDCINFILKYAKNIYYRLSIIEKVSLQKELKKIKDILKYNNYLDNLDLQKNISTIKIIDIKKTFIYFQKIIKQFLPLKLKTLLKHIIKGFCSKTKANHKILMEIARTQTKQRLILIGTPLHGNLGDHAIAIAEKELFKKYIPELQVIEITMPDYRSQALEIKKHINKKDIIITSGGGWLGNLWQHNEDTVRNIVSAYPDNKIVILPQTIYFEDTEEGHREIEISRKIYSSHKNLIFCLRDKVSYEFVLNNRFVKKSQNCLYMPDMALALNPMIYNGNRDEILLCFRTDREKCVPFRDVRKIKKYLWEKGENTIFTTTVYHKGISLEKRQDKLDEKFKEFSSAKLIITDRLHGMLFAAITGTPCIAFDNITGKVKGVYEWIKNLEYIKVVSTADELIRCVDDLLLQKVHNFYNNYFLKEYFLSLIKCILN